MIEQSIPNEFTDLANVQASNQAELLDKEHVVGVALGHKVRGGEDTGERALTVLVDAKLDGELLADDDMVPDTLDGMPVDVKEVGTITAGPAVATRAPAELRLDDMDEVAPQRNGYEVEAPQRIDIELLTGRVRPAMGGYSCGHPKVTAGTIATGCRPATPFPGIPSRYFLLSNNHVLANSNFAAIGDPTLQPGVADGGTVAADTIGRLAQFVPIKYKTATTAPLNYVDAAISQVPFHLLNREIFYIGYVRRLYIAPKVGDILQKTGRTTNYTTGRVTDINATLDVGGYVGGTARFARQILTTAMSAGGDSGSLVTNLEEEGVGLLFAGSNSVTVMNHLHYVQAFLGVRITEL
ncbi:MAG: serine protease [Egibacteraceae bacterium]